MTCKELAANKDPMKTLYLVICKEAYMNIQPQHDKKTRTLKYIIDKLSYAVTENTEPASSGSLMQ
ncbi:hypothetical protein Hanom_Chr03g00249301 [Helianthus anomalus]